MLIRHKKQKPTLTDKIFCKLGIHDWVVFPCGEGCKGLEYELSVCKFCDEYKIKMLEDENGVGFSSKNNKDINYPNSCQF